jgi:mRNA interferase MazF
MKGDVVVVGFPFGNLTAVKKRPALVLIDGERNDLVLAAISSSSADGNGIPLAMTDFVQGQSSHQSVIRASASFTCDKRKILSTAGTISPAKHREVIAKIVSPLD